MARPVVTKAQMEKRIARFGKMKPQSGLYDEALGIPREAYELMAAKTLYLLMAPETLGGPMAQQPAIVGPNGMSVIIARCPPGDKPLLHAHNHTVENFMCLTGRFRIRWGDQGENDIDLEPFDMISVPPGIVRQFENVTDRDALLLVIISGQGDKDFDDLEMPGDSTKLMRERFGQDVLDRYKKIGVNWQDA